MAALLTISELAVWAQETIEPDDEWAAAVLEAASDVVRDAANQPTWLRTTAPPRARQIASHLAARSYKNPDSIVGEGNLGPVGGDRFVEELAKALHLTAAEREELGRLGPAGATAGKGLWVQPFNATPYTAGDIYLPDDSGSDWQIPYLADGDLPALG
jgi:hypothetical protein